MKLFAIALALFSVQAAQAACTITKVNNEKNTVATQMLAKPIWSDTNTRNPNTVTMSDGATVTFFIETIMTNPDSGIETITIQDQKPETCTSKFLFRTVEPDGQSVFSGVATTCRPDDKQIVDVACWF